MSDKPAGLCEVQLSFLAQMPLLQQVLGSAPLCSKFALLSASGCPHFAVKPHGLRSEEDFHSLFKISSDVPGNAAAPRICTDQPSNPLRETKPGPSGARMDPSLDSYNAQVVLLHILTSCQQTLNYLSSCPSVRLNGSKLTVSTNFHRFIHYQRRLCRIEQNTQIRLCFTLAPSSKAFSAYF